MQWWALIALSSLLFRECESLPVPFANARISSFLQLTSIKTIIIWTTAGDVGRPKSSAVINQVGIVLSVLRAHRLIQTAGCCARFDFLRGARMKLSGFYVEPWAAEGLLGRMLPRFFQRGAIGFAMARDGAAEFAGVSHRLSPFSDAIGPTQKFGFFCFDHHAPTATSQVGFPAY